jgi:hypothetical protein
VERKQGINEFFQKRFFNAQFSADVIFIAEQHVLHCERDQRKERKKEKKKTCSPERRFAAHRVSTIGRKRGGSGAWANSSDILLSLRDVVWAFVARQNKQKFCEKGKTPIFAPVQFFFFGVAWAEETSRQNRKRKKKNRVEAKRKDPFDHPSFFFVCIVCSPAWEMSKVDVKVVLLGRHDVGPFRVFFFLFFFFFLFSFANR